MHVDAVLRSVFFENAAENFDNFLFAGMRLAIQDRFVFGLSAPGDIGEMLLFQPIIPATIPSCQIIGVFLKSIGQLSAGQSSHIEIAFLIGVVFNSTAANAPVPRLAAITADISRVFFIRCLSRP